MRKWLSMFVVLILIVTSASSCKPILTTLFVNNDYQAKQLAKESINMQKANDSNPFISKINNVAGSIFSVPNGDVYVGALDGLYKSSDDGLSFNKISDLRQINNFAISSIGDIYLASDNGLYKSTDGTNFHKINDLGDYIQTVNIAANGDIYVGENNLYSSKIYKSTNGVNFNKISDLIFSTCQTMLIKSNGDIYVGGSGYESKGGLYKSTDGGMSFKAVVVNIDNIEKIIISNKNIMYLGTRQGLYKSNDGTNFHKINDLGNDWVFTLAISTNEVIYVGYKKGLYALTDNSNIFNKITDLSAYYITFTKKSTIFTNCSGEAVDGLYQIDLIDNLLILKQPDYLGNKYDGFVYKNEQKLDFKGQYLKSAILDGNAITVPSTNVNIAVGEHTLILTLKNKYQQYLAAFNANPNTGQVIYQLWVKTVINKNKINYATNVNDTDLFTRLI